MYLQMMVVVVRPELVKGAYQVLGSLQWRHQRGIKGLISSVLAESIDDPGYIVWLSTWETKTDANAFLNSQTFARLATLLVDHLRKELHWQGFWLLEERFANDRKEINV